MPAICPKCKRDFGIQSNLETHLLTYEEYYQWKCQDCPFLSKTRGNLRMHYRRTHKIQVPSEKMDSCSIPKTWKCPNFKRYINKQQVGGSSCLWTTTDQSLIKDHAKQCSSKMKEDLVKKITCKLCGKLCATLPSLTQHMYQHNKFMSFRCLDCDFVSRERATMKQHYERKHMKRSFENDKTIIYYKKITTPLYKCPSYEKQHRLKEFCKEWSTESKDEYDQHLKECNKWRKLCKSEIKQFESPGNIRAVRKVSKSKSTEPGYIPQALREKFPCDMCSTGVKLTEDQKELHDSSYHQSFNCLQCPECEFVGTNPSTVTSTGIRFHYNKHHDPMNFKLSDVKEIRPKWICFKSFWEQQLVDTSCKWYSYDFAKYQIHSQVCDHPVLNRYSIPPSRWALIPHKLICIKCQTSFPNKMSLYRHQQQDCIELEIDEVLNSKCAECGFLVDEDLLVDRKGKEIEFPENIVYDVLASHKRICKKNFNNNNSDAKFTCGGCLSGFNNPQKFVKHVTDFKAKCDLIFAEELKMCKCFMCKTRFNSVKEAIAHFGECTKFGTKN